MRSQPTRRRSARFASLAVVVTVSLLSTMVSAVVAPTSAQAAVGTVLFQNTFADNTVDGTGTVNKPTPTSGTNAACLTAKNNSATLPLISCVGSTDLQGAGKLRLTDATASQVGGVVGLDSFPSSSGLDVTFNSYQWGGGGADGMAFMLAAVNPANPAAPTIVGPNGGSLGYSTTGTTSGVPNAYLGIGLDVFGNFSSTSFQGTGCTNIANMNTATAKPGTVAVRGPGNGLAGYCGLATTAPSTLTLRATARAASLVPVEVLINPTSNPFTAASGVSVAANSYKVVATAVGGAVQTLTGTLPTVGAALYPTGSAWLTAAGIPKQLAFGFVGSTGGTTDSHEIDNVKVMTFNPVPQLAVSTTSYSVASPAPGAPVNYEVTPSVLTGANETNNAISVTQTTPAGVVPVGAYGTGWTCLTPVGQTVTCTTTASTFANGTTLPVINVVAIVTGASVTAALVQTGSTSRASSADANPGSAASTTAGTLPVAPSNMVITPAIGPIAGGGSASMTGNSTESPTAIEIGTTAEQQAGTPVVLLQCPGAAAPGCFTISGSNVVISSMPSRASAAAVSVTAVTRGVFAAAAYVYASAPAAPAVPTATPGITSATVSWVAPAANGSAITGYIVTPYKAGQAQNAQSFDASATTRTITSLTEAISYTFTVAAINGYGTSAASGQSAAVVPYKLPDKPNITGFSAGDSSVTLTFTAPSGNGSAITGYVITPYLNSGGNAQTPLIFSGTATTRTVTGLIPGTAYRFDVAAQNAAGTGQASSKTSDVIPNVSPSLTFAAPPAGEVAVTYSTQLTVTAGTSPFVWSVSTGALPGGLTLNAAAGLLSGTPTVAGSFTFTVQVVDASGQTATKSVTLVIAAAPTMTFAPAAGEVSIAYSQQPVITGGTGPFTWAVSAGSLPAGVTINPSTGLISGTPTASVTAGVTITATDSFGQAASKTVTVTIVALPTLTFAVPVAGQVGVPYSTSFDVTGGTLPLTWSIASGSLPPGLALNTSTGILSGTPTTVGSSAFTVSVIDARNQTANRAVTLVVGAGPLVIVKSANVSSAAAGSIVGYTISISNTGSTSFTGVTVADPLTGVLDDAVYNADATASSGAVSYSAPTLSWTGNIAGNAAVTISYTVTVSNPDVGNKILADTVTSATLGTNCAGGSADARCTSTVTVPGLTIVKTADVSTTTPGSTVHFSIAVTNTGQTAYVGASLADNLAGVLDDAGYNGDALATVGSVSFTSPTLTWTGNLAVGATATITYSVTVADPDPGNRSLAATIVSAAAGSPCPSGNPAPQCSAPVTVLVPALSITSSTDLATTTPGSTVQYTMTIANTGQTAYPAATSVSLALAGVVDDAVYNNNATATAGAVAYNAGTAALVWTGSLAVGATVTIHASVTVLSPDAGNTVLSTVATSAAAGSSCPAGSPSPLCATTVRVLFPELTITNAADVSTTTPGSVVHYTVSVMNTGQTAYTGATLTDNLAGVLDDADYDANVNATAGAAAVSASTLTWTGNLAVGATATITYSVTVKNPDTGNRTMSSTVVSATQGSICPAVGGNAQCTSSVTVLIPALSILSSASPSTSTTPGSVVHYSATVTNTGQTSYNGIAVLLDVRGALDDATYNNDGTVSAGQQVTNLDGTVTWTLSLAPGASATTSISLTVNTPDTGNKSLRTVMTSDAPGSSCPTGSTNSGCTTTVAVLVPGLTITKTANVSTATPGDTVGYTVSVVNNGETPYVGATFTDDLTAVLTDGVYQSNAAATWGAVSYAAPVLTWTGDLAVGATATITYSIKVLDPDPGDKRMVNTVVSSAAGNNCTPTSTDAKCTATVFVLVPGLTIVKSASVATTAPGATVGYTITVTNSGGTAFTGNAFSDELADVLDDATYNADVAATSGTPSVSGSTIAWTGTLPVDAVVTITYSVTVHAAPGGDNLLTNTVTSAARGSNCASGSTDPRCIVMVPVARLVIVQSYPQPTTTPGSLLRLTATFTNTGRVPYTGITVSSPSADTVDDAIPTGDQTATTGTGAATGTLTLSPTAISWTGSIPVGGVVTVTGTLTVKNPDPDLQLPLLHNKLITGTLVSTAAGNNCPPGGIDPQCTAVVTVLVPALTIVKTANTSTTTPGGIVGYTITIANSGQTPYVGASVVDDMSGFLDGAVYNADATATSGGLVFGTPNLTWTGDLAVGATATVTYSMTVNTPDLGDKTGTNTVSSTAVGSSCPPGGSAAGCRSTVVVLTPALTIVKTADHLNATLGTVVKYTVTVTNSGQTAYPAAAFTDSLAGVLDDASYNANVAATAGTASFSAPSVSWTGSLAVGASATISYSVTIKNPDTADHTMTNTVVSATTGSNCPSTGGDSRCTATVAITNSVSLTFTKTAGVAVTTAGSIVHYTVSATNSSGSAVAADFTDPLAGITDDATYNNDQLASVGTVAHTGSAITWSGTIPAASTITVTYSVTVFGVPIGDQILDGTLSSTALPGSNNCLSGSTDPRCTSTVPVAALLIQQSYTEASPTPGSVVHLVATITNTGKLPYVGISVSSPTADTIDDAIPTGDMTASSGTLVQTEGAVVWTGDIPVGDAVTIQSALSVNNPDTGNKTLSGTLVSTALGNNCPVGGTVPVADPSCTATVAILLPGLTITKTSDTTFVVPGGTAHYVITAHNSGQTSYTGASFTDSLAGVIDDASYNGNAAANLGAVTFAGSTLTWTGDLAVAATATITYSVTANTSTAGDKTMVNAVSSNDVGSTCPPASGNSACHTTVAVLTPALTITSSASVVTSVPGATVAYTVTATNTGQVPYGAPSLTVPLAGVLDDATYSGGVSATTGTVTVLAQTLTWTGVLLNPGSAATITYSVVVKTPPTGDFRLMQTVASTTQGSTCPGGGTDPRCTTSVAIASLQILNTSDVTTTKPTAIVRNTVTFTNTGQVPYVGTSISENFLGAADDATYNGDATVDSGSLSFDQLSASVMWTGDLPVGATVTMTGSQTVNNPDVGDKSMRSVVTTGAAASNCPTANPGPACVNTVTVLIPRLTITKTADKTTVAPGGSVLYTITITNSGPTPYTAATVNDSLVGVLTDATYGGGATKTAGAVSFAGSTLTWTGDLAVGAAPVIVSYAVTVNNPDLGDQTMENAVTSGELGSSCPIGGAPPACTTLVTVLVPALDIAVTANTTTTVPGGAVGYTVTVRNSGQTAYVGASVTTQLAAVLDDAGYAGGTATTGNLVFSTPNLVWTGDLAVGAVAIISYSVTVADPATGNHLLSTSVTSSAAGSSCGGAAQCANTVTVLIPGLAVSTTRNVATATPGDQVIFTVTLHNTGQVAYPAATFSTDLSNIVDDAGFSGQVDSTLGVASYTAPNLTWNGTLHVGDSATITFAVTVRNPDPGNKTLSTTVIAPAAGSSCQAGSTDPACTASVVVLIPGLTVSQTATVATTTPGGVVTYRILVTNTGQTDYPAATVTDSLDDVLYDAVYNTNAAVAGGGVLAYTAPTLTWTGALAMGASATISFSVTVDNPDPGDKALVNSVVSTTAGSTCPAAGAPAACSTLVRVLVPALTITKRADTSTVIAGSAVRYTITVTNTGETAYAPATFTDPLAGVLDDATYAGPASTDTGSVVDTNHTLVWTGALDLGQTATVTYSVTTIFPAVGDHLLANAVVSASAGANCVTGNTDPRCASAVTVLVPGLTITKTVDTAQIVAGGTVNYTITATNTGQADYAGAVVTDSLAGLLDDGVYGAGSATSGTLTLVSGSLQWTGSLPVGASVRINYSIDVNVSDLGDALLPNRVVSPDVGSSCLTGSTDPNCVTSTRIDTRTLTLTGLTNSFTLTGLPNSTVTADGAVTMTVTSNSPGGYQVTVQAGAGTLAGAATGNTDTIPTDQLGVRESGTTTFTPLTTSPLLIHQQTRASSPAGDAVSNDYQVQIPFVAADSYTTTLDYIASTQ
jgi:large repetitive protein